MKEDWGVPDWREPSNYADCNGWTIAQWRWEFFRRRRDLREYFDAFAQSSYDRALEFHARFPEHSPLAPLSPDQPDFVAIDINTSRAEIPRPPPFGYSRGVPNPRLSNHSDHTLFWDGSNSIGIVENATVRVSGNEMAITFRLDRPLRDQLKLAETVLKDWQRHSHGRPIQRRAHLTKWPDYLRILDAREDGATWLEIYSEIVAPTGRYSFQNPPDPARDAWNAAREVQFNFPF
jgi:hypothetical protein